MLNHLADVAVDQTTRMPTCEYSRRDDIGPDEAGMESDRTHRAIGDPTIISPLKYSSVSTFQNWKAPPCLMRWSSCSVVIVCTADIWDSDRGVVGFEGRDVIVAALRSNRSVLLLFQIECTLKRHTIFEESMATQRVAKANRNESWCPIEQTLGVIGGIWKVIIIRELLTGTKRYGQLHRSVGLSAPDSRASRFAHWLVWEIPDDRTLMARANRR